MSGNKTRVPLFRHVIRSFLQYIVPLLLIISVLNIFSVFIIYQRELDRVQYEMDTHASNLSNYFEQVERFAFDISINDNIQDLLLSDNNPYITSYTQASAFDSFLGLSRYYNLDLIHIGIMALDEKNVLSVGYIPVRSEQSIFSEIEMSPDQWVLSGSTSYYDRTSKLYDIVSYYRNIYQLSSNRKIGVVRIDVNIQILRGFFDKTESDILQDLYFQQDDTLVSLFSEEENSIPISEINQPNIISSRISNSFVIIQKFDPRTLIYKNNFFAPLSILALIFTLFFILFAYRLLSHIVTPIYTLSETILTTSLGESIPKLKFKKGTPEVKVIFDGFNQLVDNLNEYIDKNQQILRQEQLAETLYLQSQINPHFLYNTLDALRWIALRNKDTEVAEEIYNLSNIYRYYLNHGDTFVPIQEELQLIDTYMAIQAIRFGEKFDFRVDIDEEDKSFLIPKLLLQPFIENSILHGFSDKECDCQIQLSVKRRHNALLIRILDNGCGIQKDVLQRIKNSELPEENSYAIINIKKRLELYYGDSACITFHSKIGFGTFIRITIPEQKKGNDKR